MQTDPALDDDEHLAAEWVLGLLTGAEAATAQARVASDPGFAAAVARWEARLAPLYDEIEPAAAPEGLWPQIEARLRVPANDGLLRSLRRWRASAISLGAVAAVLGAVLVLRPVPAPLAAPPPPQDSRTLLAQLPDAKGASMIAARLGAEGALHLRAIAVPAGSGEPELWLIAGDAAPVSLGQFARDGESRLVISPEVAKLLQDGAVLALTLEPAEGAPHPAPSGTILGTARLTRL
ncbi:anti-sigma factor [Sphingomonas sp. Y38-1Y]|uniref:anti-sigma factor n=1 Tax=Sphingomonas sp. Y38-1Y TaxID=3078265 RepID=UPI0028E985FC|nr:anti-sigma factor [Sphingomonas sp. Y38-1Y]